MQTRHRKIWKLVLFLLLPAGTSSGAQFFFDDFDDGNDAGWNRYDPLQGMGAGGAATWVFTNGACQLKASAATKPATFGAARMGSYRTNIYGNFTAQMDVMAWKTNLDELFGIFGRMREPGLGTTDGYAFVYGTQSSLDGHSGQLQLMCIVDEGGLPLATLDYTLTFGHRYHFVFTGVQGDLKGEVFDLESPGVAVATLTLQDDMFGAGYAGMFIYDNSSSGKMAVDFTADNFSAGPARPELRIVADPGGGQFAVVWPDWADNFTLYSSGDLGQWTAITSSITNIAGEFRYTAPLSERGAFRLMRSDDD